MHNYGLYSNLDNSFTGSHHKRHHSDVSCLTNLTVDQKVKKDKVGCSYRIIREVFSPPTKKHKRNGPHLYSRGTLNSILFNMGLDNGGLYTEF